MTLAEQFALEDYRLLRDYEASGQTLLVSLMALSVPVGGAVVGAYQLITPDAGSTAQTYAASFIFFMLAALPLGLSGWVVHTSYKIVLCRHLYAIIEEHFRQSPDAVRVSIDDSAQLALPSGALLLAGLARRRGRIREGSYVLRMTISYGMALYAVLVAATTSFAVVRGYTIWPRHTVPFAIVMATVGISIFYLIGYILFLLGFMRVGRGMDDEMRRHLMRFATPPIDPSQPDASPRPPTD